MDDPRRLPTKEDQFSPGPQQPIPMVPVQPLADYPRDLPDPPVEYAQIIDQNSQSQANNTVRGAGTGDEASNMRGGAANNQERNQPAVQPNPPAPQLQNDDQDGNMRGGAGNNQVRNPPAPQLQNWLRNLAMIGMVLGLFLIGGIVVFLVLYLRDEDADNTPTLAPTIAAPVMVTPPPSPAPIIQTATPATTPTTTTTTNQPTPMNRLVDTPAPVVVAVATPAPTIPLETTLAPTTHRPTGNPTLPPAPTLQAVQEAGILNCGVTDLAGRSMVNPDTGEREGFSVDLCRALAAAALGDDNVNLVPVDSTDRFITLQQGAVDVLASSDTHTMERDVFEPTAQAGFKFSTPYLYDGMRFAGFPPFPACAENSVYDGNCTGLSICVVEGTTHVDIVRDLHQGRATIITARNIATFYNFFRNGLCQVLAGDQFEIASGQAGFSGEDGYQVGSKAFSKEPLALVTRQGDTEWSDFVEWVLQALFTAEEEQIGQTTASIFPMSEFYRPSMFIDALRAVGNYGEMYERHLEPILPRSGLNRLNEGDSGLIYSLPFGSVETSGPVTGPTLNSIVERGFLNCGVSREDAFTKFENGTYSGFDVDLCKTLSAAIFGGVVQVEYVDLLSSERFSALARGDVDVLSRITTRTYSREVKEPTTGIGFEYSMPYFYDGMSFGGVPPYGACADRLQTTGLCSVLKICVSQATTFEGILRTFFSDEFIVVRESGELVTEGLKTGACNAIAGGVIDVSLFNVRRNLYDGPYETGIRRLSKDPLALVTRPDDPQWTDFVFWVVSALFYAEEEGITADTADRMPITNLFGPRYTRMLRAALTAAGNYADIFAREFGEAEARRGLNSLNRSPHSGQHYGLLPLS